MDTFRLLTFTTLYPNDIRPNHGIFVENRLRHLLASGQATSTVVAPVPWFPTRSPLFGEWAAYAKIPRSEFRDRIEILHPRYPVLPKLGMTAAPWLLYRAMVPIVHRLLAQGYRFDIIDAHYVYPDGVAASWLGQRFGLPVVLTARGTDISLIPRYRLPRRMIQDALRRADAVITVSAALKQAITALDTPAHKVTVLRNGVDTELFRPIGSRDATRTALGVKRPMLISVGSLIERKGHDRTIAAMRHLPGFELIIVGEGPERQRLSCLIDEYQLNARVRLLGACPHHELPQLYEAADASILASSREGWANVLLESMACGTPVVASSIWGNPEVVRAPEAGLIYQPNTDLGIVEGVRRLFAALPLRAATRAYAEAFSWDETTAGQLAIFRRVLGRAQEASPPRAAAAA